MEEVRCYDCGRQVRTGEAIKQNEGEGSGVAGGYGHRSGWGAGTGSWKNESKSYWLCFGCDRRRVENKRFWNMVMIIAGVAILVIGLLIFFFLTQRNSNGSSKVL